jgi:hypothetical protein
VTPTIEPGAHRVVILLLSVVDAQVTSDASDSPLRSPGPSDTSDEASIGVTLDDVRADEDGAIAEIVARYRALARQRGPRFRVRDNPEVAGVRPETLGAGPERD